jgi:hypothetical protein
MALSAPAPSPWRIRARRLARPLPIIVLASLLVAVAVFAWPAPSAAPVAAAPGSEDELSNEGRQQRVGPAAQPTDPVAEQARLARALADLTAAIQALTAALGILTTAIERVDALVTAVLSWSLLGQWNLLAKLRRLAEFVAFFGALVLLSYLLYRVARGVWRGAVAFWRV